MKHVFVETNFLVGLLRPLPEPEAEALFARVGVDVLLYLPWCAQAEASRTLTAIVNADLGFTDTMMRFAVRRWLKDRGAFDKTEIDKLKVLADNERKEALSGLASTSSMPSRSSSASTRRPRWSTRRFRSSRSRPSSRSTR